MTEDIRTLSALVNTRTAGRVGVTAYSPGDGQTRYALGVSAAAYSPDVDVWFENDNHHDYFADRRITSAVGAQAARTMLVAFIAGIDYARNND